MLRRYLFGGVTVASVAILSQAAYAAPTLRGTVTATVRLLAAPTSVPGPTTLTLLGTGLVAFGLAHARRRRRRA